jgi:hypothetical protein
MYDSTSYNLCPAGFLMLLIFPSSAYLLKVFGCNPRNSTAFGSGMYAIKEV